MSNQATEPSVTDERADCHSGEEGPKVVTQTETSKKLEKTYKTMRLIFHFELGSRKTTRTRPYAATNLQPPQHPKELAGAQALLAFPAAAAPAPPPPPSSDVTKSIYVDAYAGVTDMPPPDPLGPPGM